MLPSIGFEIFHYNFVNNEATRKIASFSPAKHSEPAKDKEYSQFIFMLCVRERGALWLNSGREIGRDAKRVIDGKGEFRSVLYFLVSDKG